MDISQLEELVIRLAERVRQLEDEKNTVEGPSSATNGDIAEFDGTTGKKIKDGNLKHSDVADAVAKRHSNALDHDGSVQVTGPASAVDSNLMEYSGTSGKVAKDGGLKHSDVSDAVSKKPVYGRVTGSNVTTTGQSLVDITGLSVALAASSVYRFKAVLSVGTSAVTTGTQYGVNFSAAGASVEAQINGSYTSTASKAERISALNTPTSAFLTTSGQSGGIVIHGIIVTGANAGNLTIKHLKVTSGTSTVYINSFLEVIKIQ